MKNSKTVPLKKLGALSEENFRTFDQSSKFYSSVGEYFLVMFIDKVENRDRLQSCICLRSLDRRYIISKKMDFQCFTATMPSDSQIEANNKNPCLFAHNPITIPPKSISVDYFIYGCVSNQVHPL